MTNTIAILDDEPERIDAMRAILSRSFCEAQIVCFDNAPDAIAWLRTGLSTLSLICLDHDLGPERTRDNARFDPGIGRDVADWLAGQQTHCPIIIHSTNDLAVPGMKRVLEETGWNCRCVTPYGDLDWIGEVWLDAVNEVLTIGPK